MKPVIVLFAALLAVLIVSEVQSGYVPVYLVPQNRAARAAIADNGRIQRDAGGEHHHDVVDFGAHTGHHGAFGWYADFPVYAHAH